MFQHAGSGDKIRSCKNDRGLLFGMDNSSVGDKDGGESGTFDT